MGGPLNKMTREGAKREGGGGEEKKQREEPPMVDRGWKRLHITLSLVKIIIIVPSEIV